MLSHSKDDPVVLPTLTASPKATLRYRAKQEMILVAAARLFNTKGVRGTTLSDVAASVGLITTSVTYYYKKKDDLAVATFLRTIDFINALIDDTQAEAEQSGGDPGSWLRIYLRRYFLELAAIDTGERAELSTFADVRTLTGSHHETVARAYTALFRRTRRMFEGVAGLTREDRNARTHLLFSINFWAPIWLRHFEPEDYANAARRMSDILIGGLTPSGTPAWPPPRLELTSPAAALEPQKEAFLSAATALINEQGYTGASVERIAARLRVTKGSFYYYNDNKDDVVAACYERTFETVRAVQNAAIAQETSGWNRLTSACDALVRREVGEPGSLLRTSALASMPEALRQDTIQRMARLSERYAALIVDGAADGSIKPTDPLIASRLIDSMINAASELHDWVPGVGPDAASYLYVRPLFTGLFTP